MGDGENYSTVFSGEEMTNGVHYLEVVLGGEIDALFFGIARAGLGTAEGKYYTKKKCKDAWFMQAVDGSLFGNGNYHSSKAGAYVAGDRAGMLLNLDEGSLLFFKNGAKHGPGWEFSVTGPVVLAMQMMWVGSSGEVVADAVVPSSREVRKNLCYSGWG
jgi:hypothetical protein